MEEKVVQSLPEREFQSANSSIISQVFRGILVGLFVGGIVGLFRLMIEKSFHWIQSLYEKSHENLNFSSNNFNPLPTYYVFGCLANEV